MKKTPVILDCDPGLDDIIAILMAHASERLDIKAITVVAGNQTLDIVTENTLKLLDFVGIDLPVAKGYEKPLERNLVTAEEVHGQNGLDGLELPKSNKKPTKIHAIELMAEILEKSEEKVTIIALGPLTNVAMLLNTYPHLKEKIEKISLMGGAIRGGNKTPAAEFNIYVDPEAADYVFRSGLEIVMAGLDVTHQANVLPEDIKRIEDLGNKTSKMVVQLVESMRKYHLKFGFDGCHLHDPVSVCYVIDPSMMTSKKYNVQIETKGEHTLGETVVDVEGVLGLKENVTILLDVDREKFIEMIIEAVKKYH